MTIRRGEPIYTDGNDDEPEETVTRKNTSTGAQEPAAGLAGMTFRLSATKGGAVIHASLEKSASERSGASGVYHAVFEGGDLASHLGNATYWNKDVFQVFGDDTNITFNVVRKVLKNRP